MTIDHSEASVLQYAFVYASQYAFVYASQYAFVYASETMDTRSDSNLLCECNVFMAQYRAS